MPYLSPFPRYGQFFVMIVHCDASRSSKVIDLCQLKASKRLPISDH